MKSSSNREYHATKRLIYNFLLFTVESENKELNVVYCERN